MSASSNRVAPNIADEESCKTQLVQVETADGSIPDADSLNSKVLQVEAAGGRILSDDGVTVMETPGSGENRSDLFIPKNLQLKDATEISSRADTWSSLFSHQGVPYTINSEEEPEVRAGKKSMLFSLGPNKGLSAARSESSPVGDESLVDPVNALRTTREEKDYGRVLSDEEIQALVKPVSDGHVEHCMPLSNHWSSLFKTSISSSRELEHCMQPSTDPDVHVKFEDEDTSAAKLN
ncbi:hypothetical protein MRB53_010190 [Persea americana]|uniref:Uncharacterized protein n=1 Tax=Persea americana TaxID=3435 RepID=A0ACC2LRX7_PERAE|nr:hypothetical protein MRB53_010190 [Persea americana]